MRSWFLSLATGDSRIERLNRDTLISYAAPALMRGERVKEMYEEPGEGVSSTNVATFLVLMSSI